MKVWDEPTLIKATRNLIRKELENILIRDIRERIVNPKLKEVDPAKVLARAAQEKAGIEGLKAEKRDGLKGLHFGKKRRAKEMDEHDDDSRRVKRLRSESAT